MKKLSIALLVILFLAPGRVPAAAHVWTEWYPVDQVYTYADGSLFLSLKPNAAIPNPAGCRHRNWLRVMADQKNVKEVYQMAMTAQAAGLRVNAYVSGTHCAGNYPRIEHMRSIK